MDYLRRGLILGLRKYQNLFLVLVLLTLPLVVEDYLLVSKKLDDLVRYVEVNKVSSTNIISPITTRFVNEYELSSIKKNLPLIVIRVSNIGDEVSEIVGFINELGASIREIKFTKDIGFLILSKIPQRILTNLVEEILLNTAIIDSYALSSEYLQKIPNVRILVSNRFVVPKSVILYPFRSVEELQSVIYSVIGSRVTSEVIYAFSYVLYSVGKPNVKFDEKEYQSIMKEYVKSIKVEEINVSKGDLILSKGETIDEQKVYLVRSFVKNLKLAYLVNDALKAIVVVFIVFLSVLLVSTFKDVRNPEILLINSFILMIPLYLQILFADKLGDNSVFLSSLPLFATLNSLICGRKSTFVLSLLYAFLVLIFLPFDYFLVVYWATVSLVVILLSGNITRRYEFIFVALIVSVVMILVMVPLYYINNFELSSIYGIFAVSFLSAFANMMLFLLILPLFEYWFRLATPFISYELTTIEHPLLRMLMEKAPGTYQHSQNISILAEAATEAIGANTLLAKAGALYHDIGKVYNPDYFTENIGGKTREDVNIYQYTEIIKSHVTKGVELARKYRLPREIENMIWEHHSDSLIKYFYQQAFKISPNVDSEFFRYHNPKPRSKESAILMLCDVIEARTRSEKELSYEKIDYIVDDVVSSKIIEGHLDNSKLTLFEISKIKEALKKALRSLYHQRIKYA